MPTCFVMQPFDGGNFDSLYDEVYAPAIKAAGLEPYRVDKDPAVSIPIDQIESGIRQSAICLAEITEDNPNVWFELGYAIARSKEVVLICSDARNGRFPFDVQHRTIIKYQTGIPSAFKRLEQAITEKLSAYISKADALEVLADSPKLVAATPGLSEHEVMALASVVQNLIHQEDHASAGVIQRDMERAGYTRIATNLALKSLTKSGYLILDEYSGYEESYYGYKLTDSGWDWAAANQDRFVLRRPRVAPAPPPTPRGAPSAYALPQTMQAMARRTATKDSLPDLPDDPKT